MWPEYFATAACTKQGECSTQQHTNTIISSIPRSPNLSPLSGFYNDNNLITLSHAGHMVFSIPPSFQHPNSVYWDMQITKLITVQFRLPSHYFFFSFFVPNILFNTALSPTPICDKITKQF